MGLSPPGAMATPRAARRAPRAVNPRTVATCALAPDVQQRPKLQPDPVEATCEVALWSLTVGSPARRRRSSAHYFVVQTPTAIVLQTPSTSSAACTSAREHGHRVLHLARAPA